jgi:hypothetical protein
MFITPFNAVMVLMWGGLVAERRWARKPAGGAVIREQDMQTRVRLSGIPAAVAGILTAGAVAFLLIFVVGFFCGGFHPSLDLMIYVWSFILCVSIAVTAWTARRNARGLRDLVIDEGDRTLLLPATFGREGPLTIPFQAVAGVEVEERLRLREEEPGKRYAPTLVLASRGPPPRRETLAEWINQEPAEGLARWLRKKLRLGD